MKQTLFLIFLLLSGVTAAWSQEHKKQYITSEGDTVRPGTYVRLGEGKAFGFIYLHTQTDQIRMAAARRHLITTMQGRTYPIARLTRIPAGNNNYKAVAVIKLQDPRIHRLMAVEYFIDIENALKAREIAIIKP